MVETAAIGAAVREAIAEAATGLRPDMRAALEQAIDAEPSERGRAVLRQLVDNDDIARNDGVPVCQDTGTVWVRLAVGTDERLGGDLQVEVDQAVADAYREGALRMSVTKDALCDRDNSGDNTPAFLDVRMRPGSGVDLTVMLKGGGSDNSSALTMLAPAQGRKGIVDFVVDHVLAKATGACPPVVIGVGVGGTFDTVAKISKDALLREVGAPGAACVRGIEQTILERVNASGIGPAGLGGRTTALAVHVQSAPSHIASLPVAVNMGCCALRSVTRTLT